MNSTASSIVLNGRFVVVTTVTRKTFGGILLTVAELLLRKKNQKQYDGDNQRIHGMDVRVVGEMC